MPMHDHGGDERDERGDQHRVLDPEGAIEDQVVERLVGDRDAHRVGDTAAAPVAMVIIASVTTKGIILR